tara:strand:- start:14 stop:436 length:423 start_codon:yes stop_codon:yes gene_type:complete
MYDEILLKDEKNEKVNGSYVKNNVSLDSVLSFLRGFDGQVKGDLFYSGGLSKIRFESSPLEEMANFIKWKFEESGKSVYSEANYKVDFIGENQKHQFELCMGALQNPYSDSPTKSHPFRRASLNFILEKPAVDVDNYCLN